MNWNSDRGKALLWAAWPAGYLARRGVLTLGGFTCLFTHDPVYPDRGGGWLSETGPCWTWLTDLPAEVLRRGALLPRPDTDDAATKACLLRDLWEAAGKPASGGEPAFGLTLERSTRYAACARDKFTVWRLCNARPLWEARIDTDDPAVALVRARALLRDEKRTDSGSTAG